MSGTIAVLVLVLLITDHFVRVIFEKSGMSVDSVVNKELFC